MRGAADSLFKNGSLPGKVLSKDIYLGSIPWVILQLLLVIIVIFFPQTVTVFLDKPIEYDINQIRIEVPEADEAEQAQDQSNMDDLLRGLMKENKSTQ